MDKKKNSRKTVMNFEKKTIKILGIGTIINYMPISIFLIYRNSTFMHLERFFLFVENRKRNE